MTEEPDMPYKVINGLPKFLRENLPKGAQIIYRETYNSAWRHYDKASKRRGTDGP